MKHSFKNNLLSLSFATVITAVCYVGCGTGVLPTVGVSSITSGGGGPSPTPFPDLILTTGQAASVVIGQADFITSNAPNPTAQSLQFPLGNVLVNEGILFIPDMANNRILGYNTIPTANYPTANFVFGQTNFTSGNASSPPTQTSFNAGQTIGVSDGKMAIADAYNNRVLIYNTIPTTDNPSASVVVGQTDFTSDSVGCSSFKLINPQSIYFGNGKLIIADNNAHRVLIYNTIPSANAAAANLVLGQSDFTHCQTNRGGFTSAANTLSYPSDVWTDGTRLMILDAGNNRVLIWNTFPTTNGQAADIVLGQPDFVSHDPGLTSGSFNFQNSGPSNIYSNGKQLVVADGGNNRILMWNSFPTQNTSADVVLGQANFTSNAGGTTATSMSSPAGVYIYGKKLFVTDLGNSRVLIFQGQ